MAGHVGQCRVRSGGNREDADREPVEPVGQVDGVRLRDEHEHGEQQVAVAEIRNQPLEERKDDARVVHALVLQDEQHDADRDADQDLEPHLVAGQQPVVRAADDLQIVVGKSDGAVPGRRQHRDPDEDVRQVGPQQRRHQGRRQDQQPAHRRGPGLGAMRLRPFGANHLTDLKLTQLPDQPRAERQADRERRQRRRRSAERDVARHVEHRELAVKRVEQVIQHQPRSALSRSTTRSVLTPRDPFTSTRSPLFTSTTAASAASSLVTK